MCGYDDCDCEEDEPQLEPGEDVVHGCRTNERGEYVGKGCDKWTGCLYGERGCGCCYIHCLCQHED